MKANCVYQRPTDCFSNVPRINPDSPAGAFSLRLFDSEQLIPIICEHLGKAFYGIQPAMNRTL
ncbi:MAG: hypothetical protein ACYT04_66470 [Nostoc sp.]